SPVVGTRNKLDAHLRLIHRVGIRCGKVESAGRRVSRERAERRVVREHDGFLVGGVASVERAVADAGYPLRRADGAVEARTAGTDVQLIVGPDRTPQLVVVVEVDHAAVVRLLI